KEIISERKSINPSIALRLAKYFGMSPDFLDEPATALGFVSNSTSRIGRPQRHPSVCRCLALRAVRHEILIVRHASNYLQSSEGAPTPVVYEAVANALGIDENERLVLLPSKTQPIYKNRAGWAHDRLKRAGLSSSPKRGYWKLTDNGIEYAQSHPTPLADDEI